MYIYILFLSSHFKIDTHSLSEAISEIFSLPTKIKDEKMDLSFAYDVKRNQYNSTKILYKLLEMVPKDAIKVIGLTRLDLFIPIFTYVFGEAQLNGKVGVVSTYRLRNELYGLPEDKKIFQERVEKEIMHELGHTFGLVHCENDCLMRSSSYVEEIDLKPSYLCSECEEFLDKVKDGVAKK